MLCFFSVKIFSIVRVFRRQRETSQEYILYICNILKSLYSLFLRFIVLFRKVFLFREGYEARQVQEVGIDWSGGEFGLSVLRVFLGFWFQEFCSSFAFGWVEFFFGGCSLGGNVSGQFQAFGLGVVVIWQIEIIVVGFWFIRYQFIYFYFLLFGQGITFQFVIVLELVVQFVKDVCIWSSFLEFFS